MTALAALALGQGSTCAASADDPPKNTVATTFFPGRGSSPPTDPHDGTYRYNPAHLADGKRLFTWYNCGGCHFNGGGGIGPALMDDRWVYGDRIDQVFASIYQGRSNGMPAWGGKIPNAQIWDIAAYVLSLRPQEQSPGATPPPME